MATATPLPISVREYLHTSYQPDCDFVDGHIEERNLGELDHAELQSALLVYLERYKRDWGIRAVTEIRIRTSATRVRIADVAVLSVSAPREQVIQTPPVAVIEILSPEDRPPRYGERINDYRRMGIKGVWVIDPATRKGFDCTAGDWVEVSLFAVPGSAISIDLAALFAAIDEDHAR